MLLFYVRTYVDHVKNICHLELANPLTKRTLLVIACCDNSGISVPQYSIGLVL